MKKLFLSFTALFTLLSGLAQTPDKAKLDTLFARLAAHDKAMATVAIYKNGKALYNNSIGYKLVSEKEKLAADTKTKYRIGSVTKMFTAAMIFQLVDEKKLTLDTRLDKFFPKIANADKITIGQMLNHRSGIHNFTDDEDYPTYHTAPKTQAQMLELFYTLPADFEPGEKMNYSNTAYVLLGYIIEKATGKTYAEAVKTRIADKLGLKDTYYGANADAKKNEAFSYSHNGYSWVQESETNMDIPHGAGALVATATDLTKFATGLFQGKLFSDSLLKKMTTITEGCGMGCFVMPFYSHTSYGHTGGIDGFSSMMAYFNDDSLAVAITANGLNYSLNDIMIGVLSCVYLSDTYKVPDFKTLTLNPEKLAAYEGVYAAAGFPLKITIKANGNALTAQATGQPSFPLETKSETLFMFDPAGIEIEFIMNDDGSTNSFRFNQMGAKFVFTKE